MTQNLSACVFIVIFVGQICTVIFLVAFTGLLLDGCSVSIEVWWCFFYFWVP